MQPEKHAKPLNRTQVAWIRSHYIPRDQQYGATALSKRFKVSVGVITDVVKKRGGYKWDT